MADAINVLQPTVFYQNPKRALDWLERAFGFEVSLLLTDAEGNVAHSEMSFGNSSLAVGGEWSSKELLGTAELKSPRSVGGVGTQFVAVIVDKEIDRLCEQARKAGATITQEPADQVYGARTFRALDLEGHVWTFRQFVRDVPIEEMERALGLKVKT